MALVVTENKEYLTVKLSCFEIHIPETVNCLKKYQFVESGKKRWLNGFTEVRELWWDRYAIRSTMSKTYSIINTEDFEPIVKYYLRLNGYSDQRKY